MADGLTNYVSSRLDSPGAPMVLKCVPYGRLEDVSFSLSLIDHKLILRRLCHISEDVR